MTERKLIPCPICHGSTKESQGVLVCIANCRTQFWGLDPTKWYVGTDEELAEARVVIEVLNSRVVTLQSQVTAMKAQRDKAESLLESKGDTPKSLHLEGVVDEKNGELKQLKRELSLARLGMPISHLHVEVVHILEWCLRLFEGTSGDWASHIVAELKNMLNVPRRYVQELPVGYKLVRREITTEMDLAYHAAHEDSKETWEAMWDAAPEVDMNLQKSLDLLVKTIDVAYSTGWETAVRKKAQADWDIPKCAECSTILHLARKELGYD